MTTPKDNAPAKATHRIAPGHQLSVGGKLRTAGHGVSAEDFRNKADPDGRMGLQRLVDSGRLVKGAAGKGDDEAAGGGVVGTGGTRGAGPSGAQITAADSGDQGSAEVVDAALSGTVTELEQAANPNAEKDAKAAAKADAKAPK